MEDHSLEAYLRRQSTEVLTALQMQYSVRQDPLDIGALIQKILAEREKGDTFR